MSTNNTDGKRPGGNVGRKSKSTFVTKSGQTIKINRSIGDKLKARKARFAQKRAERMIGVPKSRFKRFFYRLHPKRVARYWFSRQGVIMGLKLFGIGTLTSFLILIAIFAYFRKDLPNIRDVSGNNIGGSIQYYDRTGQTLLWEDYDAVKRIPVKGENISDFVKKATVAIEDKDFYKHGGFDVKGITRAGVNDVFGKGGKQGGSTITQQLVKLTQDWSRDRTVTRKVKELILSVELEREYSKQEILTGYLNTAPYGSIDYGVEAASQDYFNKSAKDLTLEEAAMLAAIPKSPNNYSPYNKTQFDKEELVGRVHYILDQMLDQNLITKQQRDDAKKVDFLAKVKPRKARYEGVKAPWFVLTAKESLAKQKGSTLVKLGGWRVTTTLDLNAQAVAEDSVQKGLSQVRRQGGDTAAFVAEDVKTGQVVALVGGDDFLDPDHGQNNYAHDLELPPGSSFKPYDYAALIDTQKNVGAGSVLYDSQGAIPGYACTTGLKGNCVHDYDFRFPGPMTLRYALGGSRNVPAIKAMLIVGVDQTIEVAHKLMTNYGPDGQPDPSVGNYKCYADEQNTQSTPCYASSAIGDGAYLRLDEHVHGYATLSRNGLNVPQTYILKIQDASGKTLDEWKPSKGVQAVNPESAYIVSDILSDPNASYFPGSNKPQRYKGWNFSLKTGTTNDSKDGLMMMYSTQYSAGVWVGYHNRQRVMSGVMETMTQPIVNSWMKTMHDNLKPEERVRPASVQSLPAFIVRSHVGIGSVEPSPTNDLYPGWYKPPGKATNTSQNIDTVSNKLATECTPARAIKQVSSTDSNTFSVDKFVKGGGGSTTEKDNIHQCGDAKPTVTLNNKDFACPASGCSISATVSGGSQPISSEQFPGTVNFLVDGQIVNTQNIGSAGSVSFTYKPDFSGTKSLGVQFIDSVLYEGSDAGTITAASGGGGGPSTTSPLTITSAKSIGATNAKISWTGGVGVVNIYKTGDMLICGGPPDSSCTATSVPPGTSVYAKDTNNVSSPAVIVTP